jgi:hypothetical protein
VTGKGMIKELRRRHPAVNIAAIDYDPGASEVNQLNRIKLMLAHPAVAMGPDGGAGSAADSAATHGGGERHGSANDAAS